MQPEYCSAMENQAQPPSDSRFIRAVPRLGDISLSNLRWRGLWSSVPALLLLGLAAGAAQLSPPQPLNSAQNDAPAHSAWARADWESGVIPISDTLVVASPANTDGRGILQPVAGLAVNAPVAGQVARVRVKVGDRVKAGDALLELSSGAISRAPLPMESGQTRAEQSQVDAAQSQAKLQAHMMEAQSRLHEAGLRVAAAQRRVDEARSVLEEAKADAGLPSTAKSNANISKAVQPKSSPKPKDDAARAAKEKASRDAKEAQSSAREAAKKLSAAKSAADSAEKDASDAAQKLSQARQNYTDVQQKFKDGAAQGSDVEIARGALEDAQAESKSAKAQSDELRDAAREARAANEAEKQNVEQAGKQLGQSVRQLKVFSDNAVSNDGDDARAPTQIAPRAEVSSQRPNRPRRSIAEAAKVVRAAIAESRAAIAHADKLKKEVQGYGGKVETVNENMTASTAQLEKAQQHVIDSSVRPQTSTVRARVAGRVVNIANIASDVAEGEAVAGLSQDNRLKVYFKDSSDFWKTLGPNARLSVNILPPNGAGVLPREGKNPAKIVAAARVVSIQAPKAPGQPATVLAMVYNPASGTDRAFAPGWSAQLPSAQPTNAAPTAKLMVPNKAVLRADGLVMAAVLKPQIASDNYVIEWRMVKPGREINGQIEVLDGLKAGERIALSPSKLHSYSLEHGAGATVRLMTS